MLNIFKTEMLGFDPGSQTLRVVKDGKVIWSEACRVSISKENDTIEAYGNNAIDQTDALVLNPVDYVISSFINFESLLRQAIKAALPSKFPKRCVFFIAGATCATEVDNRAYIDCSEQAGGTENFLIQQAYTASIGMGILEDKRDYILIDFSASKTEINVFADGQLVITGLCRMGTWRMFRAVNNFLHREFKVLLNQQELLEVVSANGDDINVGTGSVSAKQIYDVLSPYFAVINDELYETLGHVNEHSNFGKILANGIYFTGGGSLIEGLRNRIGVESVRKYHVSPSPLEDNVNGLVKIMADKQRYERFKWNPGL